MSHQVVELNCPGCGARVSTAQKECDWCHKPIVISTFNSVYSISHCSMCICPLINRLINSHTLSLSFRYLRIFLLRKYSILSFGISPSVCSFLAI